MSKITPKRVVLRFDERHEFDEAAILEAYFTSYGPQPNEDFFSHLCPPNPTKMHIVIDIHSRTFPNVDLNRIPYEVFKVKKADDFQFRRLNESACNYARKLGHIVCWGTDRRQPEESDGVRLAQ